MNHNKAMLITLGHPLSVNIEALARLLQSYPLKLEYPIVLIGSYWHWQEQLARLNRACSELGESRREEERDRSLRLANEDRATTINAESANSEQALNRACWSPVQVQNWDQVLAEKLYFMDVGGTPQPAENLTERQRGEIAVAALECVKSCHHFSELAVLTAPIDKFACHQAGFSFPGHTEYFTSLWDPGESIMVLAGPKLRVGLITNHVAISQLADLLTPQLVAKKIALFAATLAPLIDHKQIKIALCGFNPHCGDQGLFGDEEARVLIPGMDLFRREHPASTVDVIGPVPADTAFFRALEGAYDGVLATYHDQGLGPLKTIHFYDAVNITGGLRHFRVSPDHGPARDLYLKGTVRLDSFALAWDHCHKYCASRGRN